MHLEKEQKVHSSNTKYLQRSKPFLNFSMLAYTFFGYYTGILLLIADSWLINLGGVILVTHTLVLSAYWCHEFTHGTVFKIKKNNHLGGEIFQWLTGACYCSFAKLSQVHLNHHVEKADHIDLLFSDLLKPMPTKIQELVILLERFYFPAIFFILQWRGLTSPYWIPARSTEKLRVTLILAIRGTMFFLLGYFSFKTLILYFFCYTTFVTIVRMLDAFQHDYQYLVPGEIAKKQTIEYEQNHTFSLFTQHPWINFLILNFGYHNAHHASMRSPWYSLPNLHNKICQNQEIYVIDLKELLFFYHHHRINRIFGGEGQAIRINQGKLDFSNFFGILTGTAISLPVELLDSV